MSKSEKEQMTKSDASQNKMIQNQGKEKISRTNLLKFISDNIYWRVMQMM